VEDVQWGLSRARVDVGGGPPVVVDKIRNTIYGEPHLPAFWKRLLIQQSVEKNGIRPSFGESHFGQKGKKINIKACDNVRLMQIQQFDNDSGISKYTLTLVFEGPPTVLYV